MTDAIGQAIAQIRSSGKIAGSAGNAEQWQTYLELGATYLYTHLPGILAGGSKPYLKLAVSREGGPDGN